MRSSSPRRSVHHTIGSNPSPRGGRRACHRVGPEPSCCRGRRIPTAVVDTALDGLELAGHLVGAGLVVTAGKLVRDAATRLPDATAPRLAASTRDADVIVRTERDRVRVPAPTDGATALISGRALDPHDYALAFAWPFAAGRDELLTWIEQTRARDIYVTGASAEPIAAALAGFGTRARVLGPPHQMTLFEAAR